MPEPEPDIVARIDTELDRLDPDPVAPPLPPPRPARPAPRRKGMVEAATARDLKAMPAALRGGTLAATALLLARELDDAVRLPGSMSPRDRAGHARELRMHMDSLAAQAPGERKGDVTDEIRERRESRLAAGG